MSLRSKLLVLFLAFAVVPVLALGGYEFFASLRAVESLVATQNSRVAARAARALESRGQVLESDLLLLSENVETQRWLGSPGDSVRSRAAESFMQEAWGRIGAGYSGLTLTDTMGRRLLQLGSSRQNGRQDPERESLAPIVRPIHELHTGRLLGRIALRPQVGSILPLDLMGSGLGERSFGMVVDRSAGRTIYHPRAGISDQSLAATFGPGFDPVSLERNQGTFRYQVGDTVRIAAYARLAVLPWVVVISGAVDEFSAPFVAVGRSTVMVFLVVALVATLLFGLLLRRTTRTLEELTGATAVVGQGNFSPVLPAPGRDEIGRLTASFSSMVAKIRDMVEEVRIGRQMAVLGEFAAQMSHEIRNPLTSIKLNLQKLARARESGTIPDTLSRPLEISLREIIRLEGVVRGVLDLARTESGEATARSLRLLVAESVEVIADQAAGQGVEIATTFETDQDTVMAHSALSRALLNLELNALEAMPGGGRLVIACRRKGTKIRLTITDSGAGIAPERRAEVFRPFQTSKPDGTGLGLPIARRVIEDHGGTIAIGDGPAGVGTTIAIELPVVAA